MHMNQIQFIYKTHRELFKGTEVTINSPLGSWIWNETEFRSTARSFYDRCFWEVEETRSHILPYRDPSLPRTLTHITETWNGLQETEWASALDYQMILLKERKTLVDQINDKLKPFNLSPGFKESRRGFIPYCYHLVACGYSQALTVSITAKVLLLMCTYLY
jgi:hypothetical protein